MLNLCNSLSIINSNIRDNSECFILESERFYHDQLKEAVSFIRQKGGREIVMLAGPSSSGKTTTANKLLNALSRDNGNGYVISLDDFYLNAGEGPKKEDGTYDFESVHSLDLPLLHSCMERLIQGKETQLPLFDFKIGRRTDKTKNLTLGEQDFVIIEGLHALNPLITSSFSSSSITKLYISVNADIFDDKGEKLLSREDLRFIRRVIRDYKYRNSSADNTFMLWQSVIEGEQKYLLPHRDNADIKLNSYHPYELCIMRNLALPILESTEKEEYREKAEKLTEHLSLFFPCDCSAVPADSLLREFIGPLDECL